MNLLEGITHNKALRLKSNGERLTYRVSFQEITQGGETPHEFVNRILEEKNLDTCLVERYQKNGDTYKKLDEFEYTYQPSEDTEMITKPEPVNGRLHTGFDGLLLRQYERWYNEEVDKNRLLRTELDQTARELARCKNELQLFELKKSLEFQQRDFQQERKAKQGLDGIMDTLEKNTFLQGLLEKVVDNLTKKDKTPQTSGVNDPDIQQAITGSMDVLVKLATTDKEHFALVSLIQDKVSFDKPMAQHIYKWMNTPKQETPVMPL